MISNNMAVAVARMLILTRKIYCGVVGLPAGWRWRCTIFAVVSLLLASCAASERFMGISLQPGAAGHGLPALAARARAGDKRAQLELGVAFEEGRGVERDLRKARSLYQQAAANSGRPGWVYVPSAGTGQNGRIVRSGKRERQFGLAEAKLRLEALDD